MADTPLPRTTPAGLVNTENHAGDTQRGLCIAGASQGAIARTLRRAIRVAVFAALAPGLGWAVLLGAMQPDEVRDVAQEAWHG
jgi:hypothetical protein